MLSVRICYYLPVQPFDGEYVYKHSQYKHVEKSPVDVQSVVK